MGTLTGMFNEKVQFVFFYKKKILVTLFKHHRERGQVMWYGRLVYWEWDGDSNVCLERMTCLKVTTLEQFLLNH